MNILFLISSKVSSGYIDIFEYIIDDSDDLYPLSSYLLVSTTFPCTSTVILSKSSNSSPPFISDLIDNKCFHLYP